MRELCIHYQSIRIQRQIRMFWRLQFGKEDLTVEQVSPTGMD